MPMKLHGETNLVRIVWPVAAHSCFAPRRLYGSSSRKAFDCKHQVFIDEGFMKHVVEGQIFNIQVLFGNLFFSHAFSSFGHI